MSDSEPGRTANFCGTCGNEIRGAAFCMNCGTKSGEFKAVTAAQAAEAKAATADDAPTEPLEPAPAAATSAAPAAAAPTSAAAAPVLAEPSVPTPAAAVPASPAPAPATPPADTGHFDAPSPPPPAFSPPPPRGNGGGGRGPGVWIAVAGAGAAMVVVLLVLVFVIFGGSSSSPEPASAKQAASLDEGRAYQERVAVVFGPVLGAHQQVSEELNAIKASKPQDAQRAVRQAQEAATEARGALKAIDVPDGQEEFAAGAQDVLTRQDAYLAAIQSVLSHPTVAGASQLQTLSSNLTAALTSAGPAVAGEQESVSGATRLTAWARTTSRRIQRQAAAKKARAERARARRNSGGGTTNTSGGSAPAPRGNSCGNGVYAGPNTSCSFALNVRDAYWEAPGSTASVRVYSPVTNETYTMNCRPSGSGVTCSGGNNASVTF